MAKNVEEIVLQARDEASAVINNVAGQLGGLGTVLTRLAQTAGPVGFGLAGVAAAAGGIVLVGAKLADTVEQLDLLASRTGVSIERLQVFRRVIEEAGGDPETLTTALSFLNRAIATGDPLLAKLGITTKDTFDAFMQLSQAFAGSEDTAKKTEIAFQLLGRGAGNLIGLMPSLGSAFRDMDAQMRATGGLIEGEVAAKARELDKDLDTLSRNWSGFLTRIQSATVPWAAEIVQQFNEVWDAITGKGKGRPTSTGEVDERIRRTQERISALESTAAGITPLSDLDRDAISRLAHINTLLDGQRERMRTLLKMRAEMETADEARARFESIGGGGGRRTDSLGGVSLEKPEDNAAMKAREERLKELQRILGVTRVEAVRVAAALDAIEDAKKRADITKALTLGPETTASIEDFNARLVETEALLGVSRERAIELLRAFDEKRLKERREALESQLGLRYDRPAGPELPPGGVRPTSKQTADEWKEALDKLTDATGVADAMFGALFSGLQQGFSQAFSSIISGSATAAAVVRTIFKSLVDAILAELARIAAATVVKAIIKAFGFGTPAGATTTPYGLTTASPGVGQFGSDRATTTVNIYSYDLRDGVRELQSITGGWRTANATVGYFKEY